MIAVIAVIATGFHPNHMFNEQGSIIVKEFHPTDVQS
jgi:hypothetical protein